MFRVTPLEAIFFFLFACCSVAGAQSCGTSNTATTCDAAADTVPFGTYYFAPSDVDDVGFYVQGLSCDAGSFGSLEIITPSGTTIQCGCFPLGGAEVLNSCPNFPRGSAPAGVYQLQASLGVVVAGEPFTIVHTQSTSTAPTPTQTATTIPTSTATVTTTTTQTDTLTSAQVTVTTPSATVTNTFTVTPTSTKTTITTTTTFTITKYKFTQTVTKVTSTAPCTKATLHPCPTKAKSKRSWPIARAEQLVRRDTPNGGEGMADDGGGLTTTVMPPATIVTVTGAATTLTITATTNAPDVTTTLPANPPTLTVYSGTEVDSTTTTLPQVTSTRTLHAHTITVVTSTKMLTYTNVAKVTPVCK